MAANGPPEASGLGAALAAVAAVLAAELAPTLAPGRLAVPLVLIVLPGVHPAPAGGVKRESGGRAAHGERSEVRGFAQGQGVRQLGPPAGGATLPARAAVAPASVALVAERAAADVRAVPAAVGASPAGLRAVSPPYRLHRRSGLPCCEI